MKVLVIEDNTRLAERIKDMMSKLYLVTTVATGEDGLSYALHEDYSLIILDLGLPDINGLEVCRTIRQNRMAAPILILTAVDDVVAKVQLLNNGADDYLVKPFKGPELVARAAALMRRRERPLMPDTLIVQDLEVNRARREVTRSGQLIKLRRKEYDILEYLASNCGRAVSRQMILSHAWEDGSEGWNNTVDVHIKHLRDKIDRPFGTPLIKTSYGVGYMIDDIKS
jgi:DNA-binding response OmpR family regulator